MRLDRLRRDVEPVCDAAVGEALGHQAKYLPFSRSQLVERMGTPSPVEQLWTHARGHIGGPITPDPRARDLNLTKRVIGIQGDTVVGRNERVFVNGRKADDIPTAPFLTTHLGPKEYYVLGDNRSDSEDSRDFGPVPRNAIFARLVLIYWPLGRFGTPGYNRKLVLPGQMVC